jgi:hypothetical protein
LSVPGARHFQTRVPAVPRLRRFGVTGGPERAIGVGGVVVAAGLDDGTVAAVEEPVAYHDGDGTVGAYRLHVADAD